LKLNYCYKFNIHKSLVAPKDSATNGYEHTKCSRDATGLNAS